MTKKARSTVDVCICTLQRPGLRDTLASIAAQVLPANVQVRVIVADNDDSPSARELADETAAAFGLDLTYLHAPARNISVARNACLRAASADWLAFIDDDEMATPGWIAQLTATASLTGADVVLGPVRAIYPRGASRWIRKGDFHSTRPTAAHGRIVSGYTCNALIRRDSRAFRNQWFRPDLGRSGGEDTEFFHRLVRAGAAIVFSPNAIVEEVVTPPRANLTWLARRRFRSGQTHAELLMSDEPDYDARIRHAALASAKMSASFAAALFTGPGSVHSRAWFLRGLLHAGVVLRLAGKRSIALYGQSAGDTRGGI